MKAKKAMPGTDLRTATTISHPNSPDQTTGRTMSGRTQKAPVLGGVVVPKVGGGSLPTRKLGK